MNLDELRTVQSKERQKDSLQHLRPSFYREVGDYISELKAERDRVAEAADDPFSEPEVGRLTDEIETAKDVVEAVYERRMGKLVKQASLAAAGMPADDEGLTAEEQDLFEDLVDRIRSNKNHVLDVLEEGASADPEPTDSAPRDATARDSATGGPRDADPAVDDATARDTAAGDSAVTNVPPEDDGIDPSPPPEAPPAEGEGVSAADVMGGDVGGSDASPDPSSDPDPSNEAGSTQGGPAATDDGPPNRDDSVADEHESTGVPGTDPSVDGDADPSTDGGPGGDVDRVTVRITRDVGSILGIDDREYTLASDDVVTLPERNAEPLVERDAAEPLE